MLDYEADLYRSLKGALIKAQLYIRRLNKEREQIVRIKLTKKVKVIDEILKYTVSSDSGYRLLSSKAHLLVELRDLNNKDVDPYAKF